MRSGAEDGRGWGGRALSERLDAVCDCFEVALRAGRGPRIEEYLGLVSGAERGELFRELLALELELRDRGGDPAAVDEYRHRFPELSDEVDDLFRAREVGGGETVELSTGAGGSTLTESAGGPATTLPEEASVPRGEAGRVIGRYMLVERLGGGTQGEVWRAVQLAPFVRTVALKLLPPGTAPDGEQADRLRKEAERPSRLTDSAILPIFEFGQADGRCFLSMLLVDGFTLAAVIRQRRERKAGRTPADLHRLAVLPDAEYFPAVAALLARIARALGAAHAGKIVHRDVKPSNILLDRAHDERIYLADFGLARDLDDPSVHPGYLLGTLLYMPPEKLQGRAVADEEGGDLYALGVTLFEAATLARPFDLPQDAPVIARAAYLAVATPKAPRDVEPRVPRDLAAIVVKAMDRNPALRYATAAELAEDLGRFARGEPVRARPPGPARRAWRRARRHRVAILAAAAVALVAGSAVATRAVLRARAHGDSLALRDRAADAMARGRLDEALDLWARAAQAEGDDPALKDLGGRITAAALREELDAPEGIDAARMHHIYSVWSQAIGLSDVPRRQRAAIEFNVRDLAVASEPPGAVVTFRATRRDGRPVDLVLDRVRAGSPARPAHLPEFLPGGLWVTATDPNTGAFAERPYQLPTDLPPGRQPPPLLLRPRRPGAAADGMVRVAGGTLRMGANDALVAADGRREFPAHFPEHPVPVAPFELDAREVTRGAVRAWLRSDPPLESRDRALLEAVLGHPREPSWTDDFPMTDVPYRLAVEFAAATGCRLPAEEEVEWAARGPAGRRGPEGAPSGLPPDDPAWLSLHAVGALPGDRVVAPGGAPVFDLFANANELTLHRFRAYPVLGGFRPRSDGWFGIAVRAGLGETRDPRRPARVLGFVERAAIPPDLHNPLTGFRRARSAAPMFDDLSPNRTAPGDARPRP